MDENKPLDMMQQMITEFGTRFDAIDDKFSKVESRFDSLEERFDTLEGRFDSLEGRFDSIEQHVRSVDDRVTQIIGTHVPKLLEHAHDGTIALGQSTLQEKRIDRIRDRLSAVEEVMDLAQ